MASPTRFSRIATRSDTRPGSTPMLWRRGCAREDGETRAWTSTRMGARTLQAGNDRGAGDFAGALRHEQARGVGHFHQPRLLHLKNPQLMGGAEAVLDGAQQPEGVAPVALEVEHRIDEMLQHHGAGDGAFLGDVADQEGGDAGEFGLLHQAEGGLPDLGQGARGRGQGGGVEGLDGIEGQKGGPALFHDLEDIFQAGLRGHQEPGRSEPQAVGPELDLGFGLFAGDIEALVSLRQSRSSTWSIRVDLPMPGSPPSKTTEPWTTLPPRVRSNSVRPLTWRTSGGACRWINGCGARRRGGRFTSDTGAEGVTSSAIELQAPQSGQRPSHLGA